MKNYGLRKGIFIAIEGIDGAGKTTQVMRLKEHYERKGFKVSNFKEPTTGYFGQQIRKLAIEGRHLATPEEELDLFLNDRIEDCELNIQPALDNNEIVILDRYYFSNIAYQGALGLDTEMIAGKNKDVAIEPDLVLILDCAVKIGLSRIRNFRGETPNHFEEEDYLEKVRVIFKNMHDANIQMIDSSRSEDDVFSHVKNIVWDIIEPHSYYDKQQISLFENKIDTLISRN